MALSSVSGRRPSRPLFPGSFCNFPSCVSVSVIIAARQDRALPWTLAGASCGAQAGGSRGAAAQPPVGAAGWVRGLRPLASSSFRCRGAGGAGRRRWAGGGWGRRCSEGAHPGGGGVWTRGPAGRGERWDPRDRWGVGPAGSPLAPCPRWRRTHCPCSQRGSTYTWE